MPGLIANQGLDRNKLTELMLEIGGGRLSDEGQNLVRLLAQNRRLSVLPQIAEIFETRKADHEGALGEVPAESCGAGRAGDALHI